MPESGSAGDLGDIATVETGEVSRSDQRRHRPPGRSGPVAGENGTA